jgi:hypothetical protein
LFFVAWHCRKCLSGSGPQLERPKWERAKRGTAEVGTTALVWVARHLLRVACAAGRTLRVACMRARVCVSHVAYGGRLQVSLCMPAIRCISRAARCIVLWVLQAYRRWCAEGPLTTTAGIVASLCVANARPNGCGSRTWGTRTPCECARGAWGPSALYRCRPLRPCCHICPGTVRTVSTSAPGLGSLTATSAPGLCGPFPHLHRDWALSLPHLRRDCADRFHICTGTGLSCCHICAGTAGGWVGCLLRRPSEGSENSAVTSMGSQRTGPSIRREHSGSKRSQPLRYQCTCTSACGQSLLNPNAGTRSAEKTKTDK